MAHGKLKSKENVFGTNKKRRWKNSRWFLQVTFQAFCRWFSGVPHLLRHDDWVKCGTDFWPHLQRGWKIGGWSNIVSHPISLCVYINIIYSIWYWHEYIHIYNISLYIYISCEPTFGDLTEPHYKQWLWLRYSSNTGLDSGWWIFSICPDMLVRSIFPYRYINDYVYVDICPPPTPYSPEN